MSNEIIKVENLGKKYLIGHKQQKNSYKTLRDTVTTGIQQVTTKLLRPGKKKSNPNIEEFWAVRDINFDVNQGDRLAVIGRNGAGKSTLLKLLSRITEPTTGRIHLKGRVASLLEVGTGFHAELTGRENIYLNGAILGMTKVEINKRFDEIVEFSEVEKFLDTPVKRYSSGMHVRLAFAVAAHLEPDVLIVDEVLAVGDAAFQKKCLGKMTNVAEEGRTILFVSHNMAAVKRLCTKAMFLSQGKTQAIGEVNEVATLYETNMVSSQHDNTSLFPIINHEYDFTLEGVKTNVIVGPDGANLQIEVRIEAAKYIRSVGIGIRILTYDGFLVSQLGPSLTQSILEDVRGSYRCILESQNIHKYLIPGEYRLDVFVSIPRVARIIMAENVSGFEIPIFDLYGSGVSCSQSRHGLVPLPIQLIDRHIQA